MSRKTRSPTRALLLSFASRWTVVFRTRDGPKSHVFLGPGTGTVCTGSINILAVVIY